MPTRGQGLALKDILNFVKELKTNLKKTVITNIQMCPQETRTECEKENLSLRKNSALNGY